MVAFFTRINGIDVCVCVCVYTCVWHIYTHTHWHCSPYCILLRCALSRQYVCVCVCLWLCPGQEAGSGVSVVPGGSAPQWRPLCGTLIEPSCQPAAGPCAGCATWDGRTPALRREVLGSADNGSPAPTSDMPALGGPQPALFSPPSPSLSSLCLYLLLSFSRHLSHSVTLLLNLYIPFSLNSHFSFCIHLPSFPFFVYWFVSICPVLLLSIVDSMGISYTHIYIIVCLPDSFVLSILHFLHLFCLSLTHTHTHTHTIIHFFIWVCLSLHSQFDCTRVGPILLSFAHGPDTLPTSGEM